jgi:hypothetical protein
VYLPGASGIQLAGSKAIAVFSAAMLAAAARVPATLAAVGIRLATLWLVIGLSEL